MSLFPYLFESTVKNWPKDPKAGPWISVLDHSLYMPLTEAQIESRIKNIYDLSYVPESILKCLYLLPFNL